MNGRKLTKIDKNKIKELKKLKKTNREIAVLMGVSEQAIQYHTQKKKPGTSSIIGRPKKVIDYEKAQRLAEIACTQKEIAHILGVSLSKLEKDKEFIRYYKKGFTNAKITLRQAQFNLAEKNPTMAIWLGKQYLGQKNEPDTKPAEVDTHITFNVIRTTKEAEPAEIIGDVKKEEP